MDFRCCRCFICGALFRCLCRYKRGECMHMIAFKLFFGLIFSFCITSYLVPLFIRIAHACNILDHPDGTVKKHVIATPYLGGAAVYLGFLTSLALVFPFTNTFFQFLIGSSLLFYLGLLDDLIAFRPAQKFFGQFIAVLCFLKAGFYLKAQFFHNIWNIVLSGFWMLLIINAFNLIDIMDGLATTVALFAAVNFFFIALILKNYTVAILLSVMIGALMAFLRFNKPRARIYLGDAGSLFIGGFFSTMPFLLNWGTLHEHGLLLPLVILAIPLLELAGLICIRTSKGIAFYKPSPDHFALYLKAQGMNERAILALMSIFSLVISVVVVLFAQHYISLGWLLILGGLFLVSWVFCCFKGFFAKKVHQAPF